MALDKALLALLKNGDNGVKNGAKNGANGVAKRSLQGPTLPKQRIGSRTYEAKPPKIKGKFDPVQHEANAVNYINAKGTDKPNPNFIDEQGRTSYMNKSGDDLQYSNLDTKKKNNEYLKGRRGADSYDQTMGNRANFYKDAPANKHAHHIAGLDQWGWIYDGLPRGEKMMLTAMLEEAGIPMGNNPFNRADLSTEVHQKLHSWMAEKGMVGREKGALGDMPLEQRMEFVEQVVDEYKASLKQMYKLVMEEKHDEIMIPTVQFHNAYVKENSPELANVSNPGARSKAPRQAKK